MLKKIGRYEIQDEIGRGGMSTVYRAYDPQFGRDVAIKVLPREFLHDPQFRIRFEREAKTIGALEHFSIVPLYDLGEIDNQPYTVARYLSGGTLSDFIKKGGVELGDAVKIISRVASALDAAHARGIIHRDLKPSNVLLDQYGGVFLSDFGIARIAKTTGVTLTGSAIIGSPPYMSPEQIQGDVDLDGRSDVYALGVILFEMLTGRPPYLSDSPTQAIMAHLLEPVPRLTDLRPDLPQACEDVIMRAMAKNRDERFATAGEMAIALQASVYGEVNGVPLYLPGETVKIKRPIERRRRNPAARRVVLAVIGLALLLILAGVWSGLPRLSALSGLMGTPAVLPQEITDQTAVAGAEKQPASGKAATLPAAITAAAPLLPTPTQAPAPVIGAADKVAFLKNNDVWIVNLDGSGLEQITEDGAKKKNLHWNDDGSGVNYILGKCVINVDIQSRNAQNVLCFGLDDELDFFEVSPNRKLAAIGINQKLYLIDYKPEKFKAVRFRSDLQDMTTCPFNTPNNIEVLNVKSARWGQDNKRLAVVAIGKGQNQTQQVDVIQILDISQCQKDLPVMDQFPILLSEKYQTLEQRIAIRGYTERPEIQNFGWDGKDLFSLVGIVQNDGYGPLNIYHSDIMQTEIEVNPVEQSCCYRDPIWSPDGKFLLFAYQDERLGPKTRTTLYYIPYAAIGTGMKFSPLTLPESFFNDLGEKIQPVLRPAKLNP